MEQEKKLVLDIPVATILKVFAVIIGLVLLYLVKDVIILFILVLIFFSVLNPIINRWEEEMSRRAAIAALFIIIILFVVAVGLLIIPPLVGQVQSFINHLPTYIKKIAPLLSEPILKGSEGALSSLSGQIGRFGVTIFNTTIGFFGGLVAIFTVIVSTFYLLSDKAKASKFVMGLPIRHKEAYYRLFDQISDKMGLWVRGQLTLMLVVGTLDLIGLLILGVPYALTLGVWSGLTELIPYVGPILGAIPAVLIALSLSPLKALGVVIVYIIVQQIEAQVLVPRIMGKAVGLSPVVIIFAILIGAKLMGLLGILLAVPIAAAISVLVREYPNLFPDKG
ncbi:MAG: AI-2E family transporter [bacterium]|nr:AI-2E family transporter [bacterium]